MKDHAKNGSMPSRRRWRRQVAEQRPNGQSNPITSSGYYDEDMDGDRRRHRHHENRIFKGSCSFGHFVTNPCLCLIDTCRSCSKSRNFRPNQKVGAYKGSNKRNPTFYLVLGLFFVFLGTHYSALPLEEMSPSTPTGRPLSDLALNQMPITISKFEYSEPDIGGWKYVRRFFHPTVPMSFNYSQHDFGGLEIRVAKKPNNSANDGSGDVISGVNKELLAPPRIINPNDSVLASKRWERITKENDGHIGERALNLEDLEDQKSDCRYPSFAKKYKPNCNLLHELGLGDDFDPERASKPGYDQTFYMSYISQGTFRDVWLIGQPFPGYAKAALKMTKFEKKWNELTFKLTLHDAMVMERLTASPRIVDIYAHCGSSVWVEALPYEVEEVIIDGEGMAKPEDLPKELTPRNDYTVEEKLDLALAMAESLADLHGFRDGVIVHDDVQLCQWLRTSDGRLKLGDFNRAEAMKYNPTKEEYCKYKNGGVYGNYRAPEEADNAKLNEQIDVFSFGNNIYGLLTGLWVFYDTDDDEVVQDKLKKGTRAYIDPRWKERSYIESKLVEVMEKCWIADVDERIDIFGAVRELRAIKNEYGRS